MKALNKILCGIFGVMLTLFCQQGAFAQDSARISFDKTTHDYGTIYQDADGNCVFTFTNTGKAPLILTNVYSSCGCTVPSWPKEPTMPGKSNVIKVKYNTSRVGAINKIITVESNACNIVEPSTTQGVVKLKIKGNVLVKPTETLPEKEESPLNAQPKQDEPKQYPKPY